MPENINNLLDNLLFYLERFTWWSVVDVVLIGLIFFLIFMLFRGTQAMVLLRGALVLIALVAFLTLRNVLPAFSWLVEITLPSLLIVTLVIFAPEIRSALDRLGRALSGITIDRASVNTDQTIESIVYTAARLSSRKHGALIVMRRRDVLDEYIQTGVRLNAEVTPELLLQIFYPNTPLHDGAVIIADSKILAASCVLPLSASGVLTDSPERQMGLRHRAGLGITEVSDAVAIVISEETGSITIVNSGRMIRRIDSQRLGKNLEAYFKTGTPSGFSTSFNKLLRRKESADPRDE